MSLLAMDRVFVVFIHCVGVLFGIMYPPSCISYALVQATLGVGTVIIVYVILIAYEM